MNRLPVPRITALRALLSLLLSLLLPLLPAQAAFAQGLPGTATPPAPPTITPAPSSEIAAEETQAREPTAPPASPAQTIEITAGRESDDRQRQRSTAAKIIIGREEIDRYGDSTLGEVLRRLPGVTTPGAPGRGGPPRLRGLGGGYTQLLIDGQRLPPGFALESLTPEQVERIEILRAPTAETGARAIAGTINIIMREGFKQRLNDLRLGLGLENGEWSPGLNWTHNDSAGPLIYNVSGSAFRNNRRSSGTSRTQVESLDSGELLIDRTESTETQESRQGLNLSSRLQWRLGEAGDMLTLNPTLFSNESHAERHSVLTERAAAQPLYETASADTDGRYTTGRLNGHWRQRLGESRLEVNGGAGAWRSSSQTRRTELGGAQSPRLLDESRINRETSGTLSAKLSRLLDAAGNTGSTGSNAAPGSEHSLVSGIELETVRRNESRSVAGSGAIDEGDSGDNLRASSLRLAAYAQDEWALSPAWSAHAGLRWEGIHTRGEAFDGSRPENRSSVWSPLLHAVWKPDPKSRDQLRFSLTRSYRAPALGSLIAQRVINPRFPASGPNELLAPDRVGNPGLRPELATGIDIAAERYLASGGVLSANLFHRRISDLMRSVTTLQTVPWSPVQRYVAQTQNLGNATMQGLELEAKFRLDQAFEAAPPVELRSNLSLFRSSVDGVPGPDNRLDQQAPGTANIGADYRFRGLPLTLGGNLNWVPGYRTQLTAEQAVTVGDKHIFDVYGLWTFNPQVALRLLASNLTAADYENGSVSEGIDSSGQAIRNSIASLSPSYVNWQLRLELKL